MYLMATPFRNDAPMGETGEIAARSEAIFKLNPEASLSGDVLASVESMGFEADLTVERLVSDYPQQFFSALRKLSKIEQDILLSAIFLNKSERILASMFTSSTNKWNQSFLSRAKLQMWTKLFARMIGVTEYKYIYTLFKSLGLLTIDIKVGRKTMHIKETANFCYQFLHNPDYDPRGRGLAPAEMRILIRKVITEMRDRSLHTLKIRMLDFLLYKQL